MWYYETSVGTFKIIQKDFKKFELWIDTIDLETYDSPEAAADAVYKQTTGWDEWDTLETDSKPEDISAWDERW